MNLIRYCSFRAGLAAALTFLFPILLRAADSDDVLRQHIIGTWFAYGDLGNAHRYSQCTYHPDGTDGGFIMLWDDTHVRKVTFSSKWQISFGNLHTTIQHSTDQQDLPDGKVIFDTIISIGDKEMILMNEHGKSYTRARKNEQ
jgi:hypothetical protein